jgi:hypothetical protein
VTKFEALCGDLLQRQSELVAESVTFPLGVVDERAQRTGFVPAHLSRSFLDDQVLLISECEASASHLWGLYPPVSNS